MMNIVRGKVINDITKRISFQFVDIPDAEFILSLRMDEARNQHLSATTNNLEMQREWIADYLKREEEFREFYFIITGANQDRLGTIRLYDFQPQSCRWGSWILRDGAPPYAALESVLMIYEIAFMRLGFSRSHFEVRKENNQVLTIHDRMGAVLIREDELNYYFHYFPETYGVIKNKYKNFYKQNALSYSGNS